MDVYLVFVCSHVGSVLVFIVCPLVAVVGCIQHRLFTHNTRCLVTSFLSRVTLNHPSLAFFPLGAITHYPHGFWEMDGLLFVSTFLLSIHHFFVLADRPGG